MAERRRRCAIYTRKSSEEGLEQAFNSLHAQREACEAYVMSQRSEGWTALPEAYDDGGQSGGTLERPALQCLLAAIAAGGIDTVVVYKVDRLTRSLGDFAKIVEVFDRHGVAFVSVTQSFNTTTSMGRLTLNMLLSFAQFEREVTGERIRDKIAASKKKGMWMGGVPPLGYVVRDRQLVVEPAEAETVRLIFRRYAELGSVAELQAALAADGIASKVRVDRHGRRTGGTPLGRGALYRLLQNRLYRGEVAHRGAVHPGRHAAIIDRDLWDAVQARLAASRAARRAGTGAAAPSLLAGLLVDADGQRLTPTHAGKAGRRYRYYVSRALVTGSTGSTSSPMRLPAADLEAAVEQRLLTFLADRAALVDAVAEHLPADETGEALVDAAADLADRWSALPSAERRRILLSVIDRLTVEDGRIVVVLTRDGLIAVLGGSPPAGHPSSSDPIVLTIPVRLRRVGKERRLLFAGGSAERRAPDTTLHRLIARAQSYRALVLAGDGRSIAELAAAAGVSTSYFARTLRLGFLAPAVVDAILHDRHPADLTARRLATEISLPAGWSDQRSVLGLD
ncbi:MAG: recombinase family protein [Marinovum algicola]